MARHQVENPTPFDETAQHIWSDTLGKPLDVLRQRLVHDQVVKHIPQSAEHILDAGCGQGTQALALARLGYSVVGLDSSPQMLDQFKERLCTEPREVQKRVSLVHSAIEDIPASSLGNFDAALCHGVLAYAPKPVRMLQILGKAVTQSGIVSLLTISAENAPLHAVVNGNPDEALRLISEENQSPLVDRHGVATRAFSRQELSRIIVSGGLQEMEWYGVRTYSDFLPSAVLADPQKMSSVFKLDSEAGANSAHRLRAPFVHTICLPAE